MPKVVLSLKEITELEKNLRVDEVVNLNFSTQFSNPIAFNAAGAFAAGGGTFMADKDYAIVSVVITVAVEAETTPLAGIALLTYQNAHNHFPANGLVQGDVIASAAFGAQGVSNFSTINPRNSFLEKGKSIFAHVHNPTATGKTTLMMQVALLPVYNQ